MPYDLSLHTAGFLLGLILSGLAILALIKGPAVRGWLTSFPRSEKVGIVILTIDLIWCFWLVSTMDMGEFSHWRRWVLILLPIAYGLTIRFVDDFLSVRALAILLLLAAEPLLNAAFLKPELSRLFVTVAAYIAVIFGLIWVGMPYVLRDQISWMLHTKTRWFCTLGISLAYGVTVLILALSVY